MPNRRGARRRMRGGLSGVDELEVQDEKMKTTSSGLEQVQGGLPAAISGTWVVINQKLLASQKAAVQRFDASRKRVDALRHMLARQRMQFFVERKRRREVQRAARILVGLGSHDDTLNFTVGAFLFGLMAFMAGAAPGLLPMFNVVFFVCMLPARAIYFIHRKWIFFLIDFCYWANIATAIFLLFYPYDDRYSAVVFAMNEGPLSGALVVWQCAWVFGSREHTFSTLMHLLPGLAVHCNRYYPGPKGWMAAQQTIVAVLDGSDFEVFWTQYKTRDTILGWHWHILFPLAFYCAWQVGYYIIVQILFRNFIRKNHYETSFKTLTQRVGKTNSIWSRFLLEGSTHRRISMFGLLQFFFTVATMLLAWPMFYSYHLSLLWQIVKVCVSLYYGSRMQCQVLPEKLGRLKIEQYAAEMEAANTYKAQRVPGTGTESTRAESESHAHE